MYEPCSVAIKLACHRQWHASRQETIESNCEILSILLIAAISWPGNRHVARNFDREGKQQQSLNIWIYIKCPSFLMHHPENVHLSGAFFWIIMFRFKPTNRKSIFIELISFKSLFSLKFQGSVLDENHHFLAEFPCKSAYDRVDAISARSAVCFLQSILQLSKKSSRPPSWLRLFIFTRCWCRLHQQTFNRSHVSGFAPTFVRK